VTRAEKARARRVERKLELESKRREAKARREHKLELARQIAEYYAGAA
jgi:hypothetical protein